jgi:hypothetical protein
MDILNLPQPQKFMSDLPGQLDVLSFIRVRAGKNLYGHFTKHRDLPLAPDITESLGDDNSLRSIKVGLASDLLLRMGELRAARDISMVINRKVTSSATPTTLG